MYELSVHVKILFMLTHVMDYKGFSWFNIFITKLILYEGVYVYIKFDINGKFFMHV